MIEKLAELLPEFAFNRYPDPMATKLRQMIAEANGLEPGNVLVGNGGDELIFDLLLAWGGPGRKILDMPPTFTMYSIDAASTGTEVVQAIRAARKGEQYIDPALAGLVISSYVGRQPKKPKTDRLDLFALRANGGAIQAGE